MRFGVEKNVPDEIWVKEVAYSYHLYMPRLGLFMLSVFNSLPQISPIGLTETFGTSLQPCFVTVKLALAVQYPDVTITL